MEAGHTTTIKGSTIVGAHDVTMTSGKDTTIESAEEKEQHTYDKQVKKSGLMGEETAFLVFQAVVVPGLIIAVSKFTSPMAAAVI